MTVIGRYASRGGLLIDSSLFISWGICFSPSEKPVADGLAGLVCVNCHAMVKAMVEMPFMKETFALSLRLLILMLMAFGCNVSFVMSQTDGYVYY